ncbi:MAG TPA: peptide chain release factor 1 [Phycisphaerae bacterium]|nr:peptide chain release factor 1 [Phycisphaerae bacterium]HUU22342.1 peptide chain release factor 1 [Phycisphaerae bacterium]
MPDVAPNLIARLDAASRRYHELEAEMNDPAIASDRARIVAAAKEHARVGRVVVPYRQYRDLSGQIDGVRGLLDDPATDREMRELAEAEAAELAGRRDDLLEEITQLLVMSDSAEIDSVILEIRAGTGGDEAALFAADLLGMYTHYAESKGWKVEMLSGSPTELGGFREVIVNVKGERVYQWLGFEAGGHRVQRVPRTEAQGRIHTSAATVAVLPEPAGIEVDINWDKDVVEHVSRAGGPGGQNVNKVASAIRLEHLPTGLTVSMRDEKSQHKNRAKARRILASRVYEHHRSAQQAAEDAARKSMIGSGDRSQRVRTYNFPQNRCTDHRLKGAGQEGANFNLQQIMAGQLDDLIKALISQETAQRLASL